MKVYKRGVLCPVKLDRQTARERYENADKKGNEGRHFGILWTHRFAALKHEHEEPFPRNFVFKRRLICHHQIHQ